MCAVQLNWFFFFSSKFVTELISISFPITRIDTHHQGLVFRSTVVQFYEVGSIGLKIKKKKKKTLAFKFNIHTST